MRRLILVYIRDPVSNVSFEPARFVLRGLVLRSTLSFSGLRMLMSWVYCQNGVVFVLMGLVVDAIFSDGPGRWAFFGWGIYAGTAVVCFFKTRGPTVIAGTPYFTKRKFNHWMLIGHGLCMLAVLFYATSYWLIIAVEFFWTAFWIFCLLGIMRWTMQPISVGHWLMGGWTSCNERDMILDSVRTWDWWDNLLNEDKFQLWDALPDWKWDLYDYCVVQKEILMAERIIEWMQLETHPYWIVASTMNTGDISKSIQLFLQVRDGGQAAESYACEL